MRYNRLRAADTFLFLIFFYLQFIKYDARDRARGKMFERDGEALIRVTPDGVREAAKV